jgi:UDP-GlcNAc3NAcA epimerase
VSIHICSIVGARPQFVKAAAVSRALRQTVGMRESLIHTGQHYDYGMSQVFFDELGIPEPSENLGVAGGSHGDMTGRLLIALEPCIAALRPEIVVVYGDTNSTLAAALAASKLHVPVAHIEAGLRSFDRRMPEEINRVVVDHVSTWAFCPTRTAVENLAAEGVRKGVVHVGDVMYDTLLHASRLALQRRSAAARLGLAAGNFVVATIHRAANTDDTAQLARVCTYLDELALEQVVVLPLHPRTRLAMQSAGLILERVKVIEPLGYLDMISLVQGASCVYTDSGGLQKEAYFLDTPCVTMRDETEWVETIANGWNRLWTVPDYLPRVPIPEYGTGRAANAIVEVLRTALR